MPFLCRACLLCAGLLAFLLPCRGQEDRIRGFVNDPGTPENFEANGYKVHCTPHLTLFQRAAAAGKTTTPVCVQHQLGEDLVVKGKQGNKDDEWEASAIEVKEPSATEVKGFALIDKVFEADASAATVRADGYFLLLGPESAMIYDPDLKKTLAALTSNEWVEYAGTLQPSGRVLVRTATFFPNVIGDDEDRLRSKEEFDPGSVTRDDRQNGAGRFFFGIDRKRLPASDDAAMQARVEALGARLIPAFQRSLPATDPSRIAFRFQVVEEKRFAVLPVSNGIILVSHDAVSRLENDAQLAFVLSVGISEVLGKQEMRLRTTMHKVEVGEVASLIAGGVLGLGVGTGVGSVVTAKAERRASEAAEREAFCLMHDAGFDLREAPRAERLLMAKKVGKMNAPPLAQSTSYLYQLLGTEWSDKAVQQRSDP